MTESGAALGFTAFEEQVEAAQWLPTMTAAFAAGSRMLDFLTAVDHPEQGQIEVVAHLVDVDRRTRRLIRTRVDRSAARVESLSELYPGASWHERETAEMFGVEFEGNPDRRRLLTSGPVTHPLLRTAALGTRVDTPWPGASDPQPRPVAGERSAARPRRPVTAPGIPAEWSRAE